MGQVTKKYHCLEINFYADFSLSISILYSGAYKPDFDTLKALVQPSCRDNLSYSLDEQVSNVFPGLLLLRYTTLKGFWLLILKYAFLNIISLTKKIHIMTSAFSKFNTLKSCYENKMTTSQLNLTEIFKGNMNYCNLH